MSWKDSPLLEQKPAWQSSPIVGAETKPAWQSSPLADDEAPAGSDPSLARIGAGVGAEVAIGVGSQATGAALAPFTLGISYPVVSFAGGVAGSIAAQKIEEREKVSVGRALFAGLLNLIPASSAARGGVKVGAAGAKTLGSVAVREAARGAAIGTGEATAIAAIDEGRAPTLGEVATYGGAGTVFGGTIGVAVKGGEKLYSKIKNRTPEQIDAMVKSGDITAADLTPIGDNPEVNTAMRSLQDAVEQAQVGGELAREAIAAPKSSLLVQTGEYIQSLKASVAPSRAVGLEARDAALKFQYEVQAAAEIGSRVGAQVDRIIGSAADPDAARLAVNAFMDGKSTSLPNSLKSIEPDLILAREKIADLQANLLKNIDSGITAHTPEMRATIARSMDEGDYLTREFRFFTDKGYRPTKAQRDNAIEALTRENMLFGDGIPEEAARARAVQYIKELDAKKLSAVKNRNYLPSSIDGFLKEKKDLGPELLSYLGEITAPGERIRGTMTRVSRGVYRDQTDAELKRILVKNGLATTEPAEGAGELFLKRNERGGSGLYVQPHVQEALNNLYVGGGKDASGNTAMQALGDLWNTGVGLSKAVKVLMNPPSYAVQVYGNTANLLGMGINPLNGAGRGMRLALSEFGPIERLASDPSARRALLNDIHEMTRYGIKAGNILDSDIRSSLQRGIFSDLTQKAINPLSKAYTAADTMGRYVAWKHHQRLFRNIFPQAPEDKLKELAATVTNDTYQNYDRLSDFAKQMSRIGIVPQFASFTMEFARNQYNQGRIIRSMLNGELGAGLGLGEANIAMMRVEGAKRLAALTGVYAATYGAVKSFNAAHGVDEEKEAALKETVLPDWDENRLLAIELGLDGKGKYANPSYIIPHAVGLSALDQGLQGNPIEGVINTLTEEFVGEGSFLGRSVYSALFNRNPRTGKPLSYETDAFKNVQDRFRFAVEDAFRPGIAREVQKAGQAQRGQGDLTLTDVALRQAGVRLNSFDVLESARFKVKDSVDNARLASADFKAARDYRNVSPQQLEEVYQKANQARKDAMQKIQRHVANLGTLGYDQAQTIQTMKDAGLGSKDILAVLDGQLTDLPKVDRQTPTDIWNERVGMLSDQERLREIGRIGSGDPQLGRALRDKHVREIQAKRRGIDGYDTLVMSLGVEDGERAAFIYRKMQESTNGAELLNQMSRKGIATPQVRAQIELMQRPN
jgi:polyhydroxyalkanoate synthesis regulator phasin